MRKWPFILAGCLLLVPQLHAQSVQPGDLVIVCNGAGDTRVTTDALRAAVGQSCLPLRVDTFCWSHGRGRFLADQTDHCFHLEQGQCLANGIVSYKQACPCSAIYLVGHSAGTAVCLAAAERLPPGYVDRIVLLAPSVSACYDLRPALCASRCGIDVFTSRRDFWFLGLGTRIVGTADRRWSPGAGRVGFCANPETPTDAALYDKLRQYEWDPCQAWSGNGGGHNGPNHAEFMRAYVLPLFCRPYAAAYPGR